MSLAAMIIILSLYSWVNYYKTTFIVVTDIHSTPSKPSPDGARKSVRSVTRTQLYQSPVKSTMRSPSKRPHPESIPSSPDYLHEEQ